MVEEKGQNLESSEEIGPGQEGKYETGAPEHFKASEKEPAPKQETYLERKEGSAEKDDSYSKILAKVKAGTSQADEASVKSDASSVGAEATAESKINKLVDLAVQKGVFHAVKVARHLEDNYALDEMHDRLLADDLHDALVKKGLLKEI